MFLLPPAPGKCQECAVFHEPDQPHDALSLFYGMHFKLRTGRDPTWADAIAHCSPEVQTPWRDMLKKLGHWTEPAPESRPGRRCHACHRMPDVARAYPCTYCDVVQLDTTTAAGGQ